MTLTKSKTTKYKPPIYHLGALYQFLRLLQMNLFTFFFLFLTDQCRDLDPCIFILHFTGLTLNVLLPIVSMFFFFTISSNYHYTTTTFTTTTKDNMKALLVLHVDNSVILCQTCPLVRAAVAIPYTVTLYSTTPSQNFSFWEWCCRTFHKPIRSEIPSSQ